VSPERLTAAEAEAGQRRMAGSLAARGLGPGDRLALLLPSSAGLLVTALGAARVGVVPVVLDPALPPAERRARLDDVEPALVVDGEEGLAALLAGPPADLAPVPLARPMHYTSGTGGRPKGVWSGVLLEADARALADDEAAVWGFAPDDVHLVCAPLHHSAPLRFALATLLAGGDVVVVERFDPAAVAIAIARHSPTTSFLTPTHLQRLLVHDGLPPLSSFRLLAHAGAPCPPAVKRAALVAWPQGTVWEFYGATEGQFTVCPPSLWEEHPGTVGRARPGRRLEVDGDGLVWCHAPPFARFAYWRDADKTAAAWRGDAFTAGDLGRLDPDGCLFLDARVDDLVISGGVNVYPAEVEAVLAEAPSVGEVAVFGVPDEEWGQRVCAAVVPAPGESVDPDALIAWARPRLTAAQRPKHVSVVAELPRTPTGKVQRGALANVLGLGEPPR